MVTITCTTDSCAQQNIDINFGGQPKFVECGGCHAHLEPRDYRDDPIPPAFIGVTNE